MKKLFLILALSFLQNSYAQFNNFRIDTKNNKVEVTKMYSDLTTLKIDSVNTTLLDDNFFAETGVISLLIGTIEKIPTYIGQFVKKRKKKFSATYEAKNTVTFNTTSNQLPKLTFERSFYPKNSPDLTPAMKMVLMPELVQGNDFFSYKVESLFFKYSKARIKTKAPHINLLVELTAVYAKIKDSTTFVKTESKSSAIIILMDLRKENQDERILQNQLTDAFLVEGLIEINVKVTEINPYKIKLEEIETFLTDNNEDLSGLFKELSKLLKEE